MRVIGTAGHVDHGKSALILALTGINPDRLREEQDRQMTIDLGFAWLTLPNGEEIGFIDVPGHRDFIDNMLAGVGGIDAALFVVAADEGVMPQTKEHLAILDLLEVQNAIVVLSKIDLIEDRQWLDLVKEEVLDQLQGTSLKDARVVYVSANTGEGLETLMEQIEEVVADSASRPNLDKPRLSIDRVFTISGFGTVVTGTLLDGELRVGEEIEILPSKIKTRIRGIQSHKRKVQSVFPGSRTAVNLTGVDVASLKRGDVLTRPETYSTTTMVDVWYRHLPEQKAILKHDQQVKMFIGAAQTMARVRVLGVKGIEPGTEGWLQKELEEPIVAVRGDHYILRRPSPGATLGGGRIADPHPERRHRLQDMAVIDRIQKMLQGTPAEVLAQSLLQHGPIKIKSAIERSGIQTEQVETAIKELEETGILIQLEPGDLGPGSSVLVSHRNLRDRIFNNFLSILSEYHQSNPLKFGILKEELKSRSKLQAGEFSLFLEDLLERGEIKEIGTRIATADFDPELNEKQRIVADQLINKFNRSPYSTPSVKECIAEIGENIFQFLIENGELKKVSADVVFSTETYGKMVEAIRDELSGRQTLSVAEVRDIFKTSRKYALAFMEHLDSIKITRRDGDVRRLAGD